VCFYCMIVQTYDVGLHPTRHLISPPYTYITHVQIFYMYVCIHERMYAYICVHTYDVELHSRRHLTTLYIYTYICMYVICIHVYTHVCMYIYVYTRVMWNCTLGDILSPCTYIHMCIYVICIYVYMHVCM